MRRGLNFIVMVFLIVITTDCRDPFIPDFESGEDDYLVVEGYINVGEKAPTRIILSRVSKLGVLTPSPEREAYVFIENEFNEKIKLTEREPGKYFTDSLNLDRSIQYRLLITGSDGKDYASEFLTPKITPAVDSMFWQWEPDGLNIYVSTHDPENSALYYKWTYEETWEIRSDFVSKYKWKNDSMLKTSSTERNQLYMCWVNRPYEGLRFTTSAQYESDNIRYSLTNLGHYSEKVKYNYTMMVHQRTMTEEEYNFLELVQKNTTVTGSLFDPLPGELGGNITVLSDPQDKAIGYVGVYTTESKRFFISGDELQIRFGPGGCKTREIPRDSFDYYFKLIDYTPVDSSHTDLFGTVWFTGATDYCVDCTLRGTNIRPEFFKE